MNILEVKVHLQFDSNYLIIIMLGHPKFPQRIRATYLWTVTQYIFSVYTKRIFVWELQFQILRIVSDTLDAPFQVNLHTE